ncbi:hypothetical protein CROQUDRAFT_669270 [Cronartium quercuum f. sp. fusiforme G11]|uniref:RING-type domain-containing protein n=1 Tax=Cronartium quercuum f. sp. fusiforme G11 TaxID=708437 RepID=A0A9P6NPQ5_9BASI|nr:hypothetical protein CROQUDRAFT_669270 [Cronartium quercuum f. sp. fusiforme G11]
MGQSQSTIHPNTPTRPHSSQPEPNRRRPSFFGLARRHSRFSQQPTPTSSPCLPLPSPLSAPARHSPRHSLFPPLNSLVKRRNRRHRSQPPSAGPPRSPSTLSDSSFILLDRSSSPPSIPNRPRHHRRPSWNALLGHSLPSPRLSPNPSTRYNTTTITTDHQRTHPNKLAEQEAPVVPLIDFQSHVPSRPDPSLIDEPSSSHSNPASSLSPSQSGLLQISDPSPPHQHKPVCEPSCSCSPALSSSTRSLAALPSPPIASVPTTSPQSVQPGPRPSELTLDVTPQTLSRDRPTESTPPPQFTSTRPASQPSQTPTGLQPPTRRIYVQGMVVARNVADSPSSASALPMSPEISSYTGPAASADQTMPSESSSPDPAEPVPTPSAVLLEQASMISRLLSVAAAATASSLLPSAINADGTPISSSPQTQNESEPESEQHGGLQNLRDALRAAFGSALVNSDTPPVAPEPEPEPEPTTRTSPTTTTTTTGARIMHRLGLHHLLSNRTPSEGSGSIPVSPAPRPAPDEPGSFERFLSELQTDVGLAILQALGGGTGPETDSNTQSVTFNFFRMHRFERNSEPENGNLVPVLLVGVRSAPPTNIRSPTPTHEEDEDEDGYEGVRELFGGTGTEVGEGQEESSEIESEGRETVTDEEVVEPVLENAIPATVNTPPARSWLIFVLAGLYPSTHPIFTAPTLFIPGTSPINGSPHPFASGGSGLDYETMLRLAELIGQAKPPTATASQIEDAHLRTLDSTTELAGLVNEGSVLANTAEKCLICLTEYGEEEEEMRLLKCKHLFHRKCIDQWLMSGSATCPACRDVAV